CTADSSPAWSRAMSWRSSVLSIGSSSRFKHRPFRSYSRLRPASSDGRASARQAYFRWIWSSFGATSPTRAKYMALRMGLVAAFVVAALILVNAVYVAAEFAAVSVRRSRIQQLADDGNPLAAWLLPIL